jgi:hypothetical protein
MSVPHTGESLDTADGQPLCAARSADERVIVEALDIGGVDVTGDPHNGHRVSAMRAQLGAVAIDDAAVGREAKVSGVRRVRSDHQWMSFMRGYLKVASYQAISMRSQSKWVDHRAVPGQLRSLWSVRTACAAAGISLSARFTSPDTAILLTALNRSGVDLAMFRWFESRCA